MKFLGKLATAVLSLSFCFSAFACVDPTSPNSSGNDSGNSSNQEQQQPQVGTSLTNAIIGQLEAANTLVISFVTEESESYKETPSTLDYNEPLDYSEKNSTEATFTIAKTETGYDLKAEFVDKEYGDGELLYESLSAVYVIDGISYQYEEDLDVWTYNPYNTSTTAFDVNEIFDMITAEESEELKNLLSQAFEAVYEIDSNSISLGVDLKDSANSLIDYAASLDLETKTLESVINDALAVIDEDLTVASILAEIKTLDDKTVGDALTAIDEFLTEEADITLQGLKDKLLADERVISLLETEGGMTEEEIQELQALVLDEALADYKEILIDQIVFELVTSLAGDGEEEPTTYEEFLLELKEEAGEDIQADSFISYLTDFVCPIFLSPTLAEIIDDEDEAAAAQEALNELKNVQFNELKSTIDVAFDNYYAIKNLEMYAGLEYAIDTYIPAESAMDMDKLCVQTSAQSVSITVESISSEKTQIALPEGAKTMFACWQNDVYLENNSGVFLLGPDFESEDFDTMYGSFDIEVSEEEWVYVEFSYTRPEAPTDTWEITIICIDGIEGEELSDLLGGDLTYTLTFDFDGTGDYITDFAIPLQ